MGSRCWLSISSRCPSPPFRGLTPACLATRAEHLIFTCYGGTHSSVVAAAMHLGQLPRAGDVSPAALLQLPWFDRIDATSWGIPQRMGEDAQGRGVYALGRGGQPRAVVQALASGFAGSGGDPARLWFIDTVPALTWGMRAGGFLSRQWHWVWAGRPLLLWSTRRAYARFVALVTSLEEDLLGETTTPRPVQRGSGPGLEWRLEERAGAPWWSPRFGCERNEGG